MKIIIFFAFYIQSGQISGKDFSNHYISCFEWEYCVVSKNVILLSVIYLHFSNYKFLFFCWIDWFRVQKPLAIGPFQIPRYQYFWDNSLMWFLGFRSRSLHPGLHHWVGGPGRHLHGQRQPVLHMKPESLDFFLKIMSKQANIRSPRVSRTPGSGTHRQTLLYFFKNHVKHVLLKFYVSSPLKKSFLLILVLLFAPDKIFGVARMREFSLLYQPSSFGKGLAKENGALFKVL